MIGHLLDKLLDRSPHTWVGKSAAEPAFLAFTLLKVFGWSIILHRFKNADDPNCFHSHEAYSLRLILSGGYTEEILHIDESRTMQAWHSGNVGIVKPDFCHRVNDLISEEESPTWSLWVRGPRKHQLKLLGEGWGDRRGNGRTTRQLIKLHTKAARGRKTLFIVHNSNMRYYTEGLVRKHCSAELRSFNRTNGTFHYRGGGCLRIMTCDNAEELRNRLRGMPPDYWDVKDFDHFSWEVISWQGF